jgi:hypothetical protein
METAAEYLDKTESAVKILFDGIDAYFEVLRNEPSGVRSHSQGELPLHEYVQWAAENPEKLQAAFEAQRSFVAESFAFATLCGAVLQIAAKAIECYSMVDDVPEDCQDWINSKQWVTARPFCIGRRVHDVPIGLVIYAGRNQATHFNEKKLYGLNKTIFQRLSDRNPSILDKGQRDPSFDLSNPNLTIFADNITTLLGWRSFHEYNADMRALLLE